MTNLLSHTSFPFSPLGSRSQVAVVTASRSSICGLRRLSFDLMQRQESTALSNHLRCPCPGKTEVAITTAELWHRGKQL